MRWLKFNAVGAMGMGVQLVVLAVLNRGMRGHYLVASAVALEVTLLHNFVWHVRFTWRERCEEGLWRGQLMRFHLTNGVVSLVGNLVLMRVLVQEARLPVVASNAIAIVCCSVANYWLGDRWAFAADAGGELSRDSRRGRGLRWGPCP
jgi:putative flippase GtrA